MGTRPGPIVGSPPHDEMQDKFGLDDARPLLHELLKTVRRLDDQVGLMISGHQAIRQEIFHLGRGREHKASENQTIGGHSNAMSGVTSMVKRGSKPARERMLPAVSKVQSQNHSHHSDLSQHPSTGWIRSTTPPDALEMTAVNSQAGSHNNELGQGWPSEIRMRKEFQKSKISSEESNWKAVIARLSSGNFDSDELGDEMWSHHSHHDWHSHGDVGIRGSSSDESRRNSWVLDPDSTRIMGFDLFLCFVLVHDLFITPYSLVLGFRLAGVMRTTYFISVASWSLEFLLGFFMGYYHEGELVQRKARIRARYMQGWCLPNGVILAFDYAALAISYTSYHGIGRVLQLARLVKIVRVLKLLPIALRLGEAWNFGRGVWIVLKILCAVFALLLYNHFICCMWLFIGIRAQSNTGLHWIDTEQERFKSGFSLESESSSTFAEENPLHFYLASLHWALAQMTPGPIDILSLNVNEKLFNLAVLLVGIFVASFLVSLMSGQVMEMIISKRQKKEMLEQLEAYMRQNGVRSKLHLRIKRQVMTRYSRAQMIQEDQVKALHLLSSSMRARLTNETRRPYLMEHPILSIFGKVDGRVLNKVCLEAVGFVYLEAEDELFEPLLQAHGAYRVIAGALQYTQIPGMSKVMESEVTEVPGPSGQNKWFCEPALWTLWVHVGRMEAITKAQVLHIAADAMATAIAQSSERSGLKQLLQDYVRKYHMRLTMAIPPHAPWPTDLHVPDTEPGDLVPHHVSIGLLNRAISSGAVNMEADTLHELRNELRSERCMLQLGEDGRLCRLVTLITLKLLQEEGRVLVEVARTNSTTPGGVAMKDWQVKNCGMLPGSKREMGELPAAALKRVLRGQLQPLETHVTVDKVDHLRYSEESPRYGMQTVYCNTVHEASLHVGAPQMPSFHVPHLGPPPAPFSRTQLHLQTAADGKITLYAWVHPDDVGRAGQSCTKENVSAWLLPLKTTSSNQLWDMTESISDLDAISEFLGSSDDDGQTSFT